MPALALAARYAAKWLLRREPSDNEMAWSFGIVAVLFFIFIAWAGSALFPNPTP